MKNKILSQPLFFHQVLHVKPQCIIYVTKEITQVRFLGKSSFSAIHSTNHSDISTKISIVNINHFVKITTSKASIFSFELPNKNLLLT